MTVLKSRRVVLPDGERPAAVVIEDGRISAITRYDTPGEDVEAILLPGLVDTHVHVNEPGRTEWEGFATATRAAAAGGVTTIVDMPLNSIPPTVSAPALETKRAAARGQCTVDVGFWGGAVPGNAENLPALHDAGVFGFKCFLVDSGVPEFPPLDRAGLDAALAAVDALFVVHAEDPGELHPARASREYTDFLASRPDAAEVTAVDYRDRRGVAGRCAGAHPAPVLGQRAAAASRRQASRRAGDRRDLPALPHARGRGRAGRRHPVQVLPADPRSREPRRALVRAGRWHDRPCRVRSFPVYAGAQASGHRRLRGGLGRHRLVAARAADRVDRGTPARARTGRRGDLDGDPPGRRWPGCAARAGSPSGPTPTSSSSTPTPRSPSTRPGSHHRHPVTPYAGRELRGVVRQTWLARSGRSRASRAAGC